MYDGHGNPSRDVGESSTFGDVTRKTEFICGDKGGGNSKLTIDHHRVTATLAVRRKLSPAINKQFPRVFVDRSVTYGRHVLVFVAFLSATRSSFRLRVLSIRYFVRVCPRHRRTRTLVVQYTVLGPGTTKTIVSIKHHRRWRFRHSVRNGWPCVRRLSLVYRITGLVVHASSCIILNVLFYVTPLSDGNDFVYSFGISRHVSHTRYFIVQNTMFQP